MTSRLKSSAWRRSVPHGGITSRNVVLISGLCVTLGKTNSASFNQMTPTSPLSARHRMASRRPNNPSDDSPQQTAQRLTMQSDHNTPPSGVQQASISRRAASAAPRVVLAAAVLGICVLILGLIAVSPLALNRL